MQRLALVQRRGSDRAGIRTRVPAADAPGHRAKPASLLTAGVPMGAVTGPTATQSDETRLHGMQKAGVGDGADRNLELSPQLPRTER
jgi:hypothetical protein